MHSHRGAVSRREFIRMSGVAVSSLALAGTTSTAAAGHALGPDLIPMLPLPYPAGTLDPYISPRTVDLHYNRHHRLYYRTLCDYVSARTQYQRVSLEQIVTRDGVELADTAMFTVAVLLWSHNVYWQSMRPGGGDALRLQKAFGQAVRDGFGSLDGLKQKILDQSRTIGVGWVWLVKAGKGLDVIWTDYQNSPFADGRKPLLALDVWEHAYYLDYENLRDKYVTAWLEHLANWDFAAANLG